MHRMAHLRLLFQIPNLCSILLHQHVVHGRIVIADHQILPRPQSHHMRHILAVPLRQNPILAHRQIQIRSILDVHHNILQ